MKTLIAIWLVTIISAVALYITIDNHLTDRVNQDKATLNTTPQTTNFSNYEKITPIRMSDLQPAENVTNYTTERGIPLQK